MPELITEEGSGGSRPARGRHERVIQVAKSPGSRIDAIVRLVDGEIPDSTTANRATDAREQPSSSERPPLRGVDATTASLRSPESAEGPKPTLPTCGSLLG